MSLHLLPRSLNYVELVARLGSIQATSREIGIAASAIDRQILLLEQTCGAPLFERLPTGMRLTAVGEAFVVMARRWRADEGRLWSEIKRMQGVEVGHVRLAAMDSQTNGVLPELLSRLERAHPRITLDVEIASPDEAVRALHDGSADLAFVFNAPARRGVHVLWSADLPLGCAVAPGHPLADRAGVTLQDVAGHRIVVQSAALSIRRYLDRQHAWLFAERGAAVATNSLQLVKNLAMRGGHVALTSELDVAPEILSGALRFVPVRAGGVAAQTISVAVNADRPYSGAARAVADTLADAASLALAAVRRLRGTDET